MADFAPGQPMEEILASIKKIIAEDTPTSPSPTAAESEDVLELGAAESTPEIAPSIELPPLARAALAEARAGRPEEAPPLVTGVAEAASRQAFAALNALAVDPAADPNTLDGLVRELLRPMLQSWLDEHLPAVVERMVAREIARLGGR